MFNSQTTVITRLHKADNPELFMRTKLIGLEEKMCVLGKHFFFILMIKTYDKQK